MAAVREAALLVRVGGPYDEWASKLPAQKTIEAMPLTSSHWPPNYEREPGRSFGPASDTQSYQDGSMDPHFWLNPMSVATVAGRLSEEHVLTQPKQLADQSANQSVLMHLLECDKRASDLLWPHRGKAVIQSRDSLQYLLRAHEIESVGVIESHSGGEPSPKRLTELIAVAKARQAKCVIVDAVHSDKAAKVIAAECGIPIVRLDPEGVDPAQNYQSYEQWFMYNVNALAAGLQ
jgi:zinc transport system substrate-binding protein